MKTEDLNLNTGQGKVKLNICLFVGLSWSRDTTCFVLGIAVRRNVWWRNLIFSINTIQPSSLLTIWDITPPVTHLVFRLEKLDNPLRLLHGDGLGLGGVSICGEDPGLELVVHGLSCAGHLVWRGSRAKSMSILSRVVGLPLNTDQSDILNLWGETEIKQRSKSK